MLTKDDEVSHFEVFPLLLVGQIDNKVRILRRISTNT